MEEHKTDAQLKARRRFAGTVYRLAQQAVESYTVWNELLKVLKLQRPKHFETMLENEDLLRIIVTNAKRSFIVTLFILCDDGGYGSKGHNVFKLLDKCAGLRLQGAKGEAGVSRHGHRDRKSPSLEKQSRRPSLGDGRLEKENRSNQRNARDSKTGLRCT